MGSGSLKVGEYSEGWVPLANTGMTVPQSGYLFVYISNETQGQNVFFDNLTVRHYSGPLVEESSYYPHGLKIGALASRAMMRPLAKYGYQAEYNEQDAETGYHEFLLRSYDPQIGRWAQSDPYDIEPGMYNGMGNDPVNRVDPLGGTGGSRNGTANIFTATLMGPCRRAGNR
jgi:RHS repeat-associated protein